MQTASTNTTTASNSSNVDAKITADLTVLKEKMALCEEMLHPNDGSPAPSLKDNQTMLTVVGFLEACAPRMVQLVEVGAQGNCGMSETVLMEALTVNDTLTKLLEDIETLAETETTASTTAASAPEPSIEEQLDDLFLDDDKSAPTPVAGGKTTGEDDDDSDPFGNQVLEPTKPAASPTENTKPAAAVDPFGDDLLTPTPDTKAVAEAKPAAAPAAAEDDFDTFLAERTTK